MALFFISFLAGVLTVVSPCVLPLLPVIVGGTIAGGTNVKRALTVTLALGASVLAFTFLLKASTLLISVPQSFWSYASGALIILIGIATLFPRIYDQLPFMAAFNRDSNKLMSSGYMRQTFWGDVIVGAALGPVFSTCSPTYFIVLATVLPASLALGVADMLAYVIGLCAFLFLIAIAGQKLVGNLATAADPNAWWRKALGILLILTGLLIVTGYAAAVEAPLYTIFDETKVEQKLLGNGGDTSVLATSTSATTLAEKMAKYHLAAELQSPDAYLNTGGQPINLAQYRGKNVVLIDFWTYSCINCLRTIPYVTEWYSKYKDQGLVIIGVHTPEFAFEHVLANVQDAVQRLGITYPVVLDNEYATWNAFQNQYWPREYLIDIDGFIVHDHAGEGDYDQTEAAIQAALKERAQRLGTAYAATSTVSTIPSSVVSGVGSPETYFGSNRNQYFGNGAAGQSGTSTYTLPAEASPNTFDLGGTWDIEPEYAQAVSAGASIQYEYQASNVYFVAASDAPVKVEVLLDGQPIGKMGGTDVDPTTSTMTIQANRLYSVVHMTTPGVHTLELKALTPGLMAYTFTFG
ncbi:MAG TPA: cytochrome c biogenesis protein DipZ [Candidatus Paceibacterota bacterium]|nr:cytochrome c biogenesis protein DipZ [Candidatus Paceibacterota bacterium]